MNRRIELNRDESIQYFDADPDLLELFESDQAMITEVSISDGRAYSPPMTYPV